MCSVDKNMCCSGTDGHVKSRYFQMTGSKTFMQYIANIGSSDFQRLKPKVKKI